MPAHTVRDKQSGLGDRRPWGPRLPPSGVLLGSTQSLEGQEGVGEVRVAQEHPRHRMYQKGSRYSEV